MKTPKRIALAIAALAISTTAPIAQTYPAQSITLTVPFPPGAATDALARILQTPMADALGKPIVIDNRAGAGGVLGSNTFVRSPPNGYTLLLTVNAPIVMAPHLQQSFPFDPTKQIAGVAMVAETHLALAVRKDSPINSVSDIVRLAKEKPGELTFGSAGVGSGHHIAGEMLNKMAGIQVTHVPFQGGGPAIQNLIGGHITMSYGSTTAILPYVDSGQLKLIALAEPKRISELPNIPTVNETVPGVETTTWVGIFAPADTPIDIRKRLYDVVADVVTKPETVKAMAALGMKPSLQGPEAFDATIVRDLAFWKSAIEKAGLEKR
jgi:tripartite-type tricarboxylate transporter receptor subunit TctC